MNPSFVFLSKYLKALLDTVLSQDGFICDDIGWQSRFIKISDGVNETDVGLGETMDGMGTNYQVDSSHGASN